MPGDLIISGGGSVVVASDQLRVQAERLRAAADELDELVEAVRQFSTVVSATRLRALNAPPEAFTAEEATSRGLAALVRAARRAETLSWALDSAMAGYGRVDGFIEKLVQRLHAKVGYALGAVAPMVALAAVSVVSNLLSAALVSGLITGKSPVETGRLLLRLLGEHKELLTSPTTVALLRATIGGSDDFVGAAIGVPVVVMKAIGDEGIGVVGLETSAAVVAMLGSAAGILRETPVVVTKTGGAAALPPRNVADRAARIPEPGGGRNGEQITIERYTQADGTARFEVYLSGTVDFSVSPEHEPFDMTSNINGIAGLPSASVEAAQAAMLDAGVTSATPVVITGYSQGGLVASVLAASGDYAVDALVTFGSPSGLISIPEDVPVLTIRHTDDIVPATGGYDATDHAVLVERHLFEDREIPDQFAVPAHQLEYYRETAAMIDDAGSEQLRDVLAGLDRGGEHAQAGEGSSYLARRVPAEN